MNYFEKFVSNTYAGVANQFYTRLSDETTRRSRIFYKISVPGKFNYSLLFSSVTDGSFRRLSKPDTVCDEWVLHSARVAVCSRFPAGEELSAVDMSRDVTLSDFLPLTFDGEEEYILSGGEMFASDEVELTFAEGDYLCLELEFSGEFIPYHPEIQIPTYLYDGDEWKYSVETPVACMIGCERKVSRRIAYLGDSITQGCGAGLNSYKHWCATLSSLLGAENAYWNLGIGYGKASDAADDGAWLYKAKQNDVVFLCYGVNDINGDKDAATIIRDLSFIIDKLTECGCRVILQTVPPFDYPEARRLVWTEVNRLIKSDLSAKVEFVFDNTKILGEIDAPHKAKFGGHPNAEGCTLWATALYESVKNLFS